LSGPGSRRSLRSDASCATHGCGGQGASGMPSCAASASCSPGGSAIDPRPITSNCRGRADGLHGWARPSLPCPLARLSLSPLSTRATRTAMRRGRPPCSATPQVFPLSSAT
jgi:hypothetical protein